MVNREGKNFPVPRSPEGPHCVSSRSGLIHICGVISQLCEAPTMRRFCPSCQSVGGEGGATMEGR